MQNQFRIRLWSASWSKTFLLNVIAYCCFAMIIQFDDFHSSNNRYRKCWQRAINDIFNKKYTAMIIASKLAIFFIHSIIIQIVTTYKCITPIDIVSYWNIHRLKKFEIIFTMFVKWFHHNIHNLRCVFIIINTIKRP